mmetsp:Transcript_18610/g.26116  ORF Transcript_18610/g.26116 Transcript_18610/m.26116 type:complete len:252 (+) Transcript_18610:30-785(+)
MLRARLAWASSRFKCFVPASFAGPQNLRWLSTEATATEPAESAIVPAAARQSKKEKPPWYDDPAMWKSNAKKKQLTDKKERIKISPRKLGLIVRPIRGLNLDEALIQMRLSTKKKSVHVRQLLWKMRETCINEHNMDPSRLVLTEIFANKAQYLKRINFHAKGQHGIRFKYYAHLFATITEVPPVEGEVRVGKHYIYGRKISTIKDSLERMEKVRAYEKEQQENEPPRKYTWGKHDRKFKWLKIDPERDEI